MINLDSIKVFCESIIDEVYGNILKEDLEILNKIRQNNLNECENVIFLSNPLKFGMKDFILKFAYTSAKSSKAIKRKSVVKSFIHDAWVGFENHSFWYNYKHQDVGGETDISESCTLEIYSNNLNCKGNRHIKIENSIRQNYRVGELYLGEYKELNKHVRSYLYNKIKRFFIENGFKVKQLLKHTI